MALKPWYNVVYPRDDLQSGRPLDASQFAVHLDKVKTRQGDPTYWKPDEFFARTFLTKNLLNVAAEMVRRLAGETIGTSPAFNMATQFGGGKTHSLTLLYHLAEHGPAAESWAGVRQIMDAARLAKLPKAKTAIFVGMNFDPRGGDDGTPLRRTPWGDIAWQLGDAPGYNIFADFDREGIAPAGETIGKLFDLVNQPILILVDELINYMSRYRQHGLGGQLYNFLFNLTNEVASRNNAVLAVSVARSEGEVTADDVADQRRILHMLERQSKAVTMSADTDTAEIIRRRLFDWSDGLLDSQGRVILNNEATRTCNAYADWVLEQRSFLPTDFPFDRARELFKSTYPFHPVVLSVFERKWQTLPSFQRTRGVLRMLALWVAHAYNDGVNRQRSKGDPLLTLGMAPLDTPFFRDDVFAQLGEDKLITAVTTDIIGGQHAHAVRLDAEATQAIRDAQLHRKVATSIFFESNGGQSTRRAHANLPEIRLAVGEPGLDIGNVESVLEALAPPNGICFYLDTQDRSYWFSTKPNLTQVLARCKTDVKDPEIESTVLAIVQKQFGQQSRDGLTRRFFPNQSSDLPNQPVLTLVVLPPKQSLRQKEATLRFVEELTRNHGSGMRTFKSALIWAVADSEQALDDAARNSLAWEMIDDQKERLQLSDVQQKQLAKSLKDAKEKLDEAVWRTYHTVLLLGTDNQLTEKPLGRQHSSAATDIGALILRDLRNVDEVVSAYTADKLVRKWSPAFTEWSTKAVRDAFYASPQFPRIASDEVIKQTIAGGVTSGVLAYVGKTSEGVYLPFYFKQTCSAKDIELTDDMYIIKGETAEAVLAQAQAQKVAPVAPTPSITTVTPVKENGVPYITDPQPNPMPPISPPVIQPGLLDPTINGNEPDLGAIDGDDEILDTITQLAWEGDIPAQKWGNFYMKVLARFANTHSLKLHVRAEITNPQGISSQKTDELKAALRELGLSDEIDGI
jgi:hypothetical protein